MSSCKYSGAKCQSMNTFVRKNHNFVHDTVSYWQPMQFLKHWGDGNENVCELQAWRQSFLFSGILLCVSPVGTACDKSMNEGFGGFFI